MRGALRVASSPACTPSLLWRHPAPGPDSALRRWPLHHSRILHSSDLHSHLPASRVPGQLLAVRSKCPEGRCLGARGRRMLRSCAWILRLRSQTGSCCSRIRYPVVFSGPLRPSHPTPFLSLSFPYFPLAFPLLSSFLFLILLFYCCTF